VGNGNVVWSILDFLNRYANLLLAFVTIIYVIANWMLVNETRRHRLQQVIPYVRVVFQKAPDKVLLENVGVGVAAKAILQGFSWKDGGEIWRCTFDTVYTILPHEIVPVRFHIDLPERVGGPLVGGSDIFEIAFQHVIQAVDPVALDLYLDDIVGNCYKSRVRIDSQDWYTSWKFRDEQRWAAVTLPPVRERRMCPETIAPAPPPEGHTGDT